MSVYNKTEPTDRGNIWKNFKTQLITLYHEARDEKSVLIFQYTSSQQCDYIEHWTKRKKYLRPHSSQWESHRLMSHIIRHNLPSWIQGMTTREPRISGLQSKSSGIKTLKSSLHSLHIYIIDAFKLWCWRRLLRVPWTERRSNQSILKGINPEYSLEGLMLKLKLQYFGHLMWKANSRKRPWCWERVKAGEGDDMVGWHYRFSGYESEQTPGDSKGLESLACCSPWCCKEQDTTERLKNI